MKRHVALRTLSSDHHHGLVQARRLARASEGKEDAAAAVRGYLAFAEEELARHFREEEVILLPEFALTAGAHDARILRVAREHTEIRALTLALARASTSGSPTSDLLAEIARLLESHIRFEERELFPAVERSLDQERLAGVGVLLAAGLPGA